jgi:lipopolysaccharide transport system ATP-binding protein
MDPIIRIENIGKMYSIGAKQFRHDTLGEAMLHALKSPLRKLKELQGVAQSHETVFWALRNVSFDVQRGDVLGIVGRNGAGKSTLLKILSKITDPTEGRAVINGRVSSLLEVGTGFHPDLTGRENVYLNGAILGMKQAEITRKFDEIVEFAEIEKFLDTPVKRYSSGMYVRLAFAVAAHLEPEILIVDEVLAVGDIQFQTKCMGKMEDVSKGGRTILFVSHNMGAIRNLCARGVLLENGQCTLIGTSNEVVNRYMSSITSNENNIGLRSRKRSRPGLPTRMMITNVEIQNIKHGCVNEAETLDELLVKIDYEILTEIDYFSAEWRFKDPYGTPLIYSSSTPMGNIIFHPENGEKQGTILCHIPRIPLSMGEYSLEVGLVKPGVKYLDHLDDACKLRISSSDPQKTGYQYKRELAPLFVESSWYKATGAES